MNFELQFVGDIKAVRTGDVFKAYGTLQSRRTGNYIKVETSVNVRALIEEAKQVYAAAKEWLARQGKPVEEIPEAVLNGLGVTGRERGRLVQDVSRARQQLADEKKKQIVQAKLRAEANRRMVERRNERKGYEDQLAALKQQIERRDIDDSTRAQLDAQAAQYEQQIAQAADAQAQVQAQYEDQLARLTAMSASQVAQLPAAQSAEDGAMQGLGWSFSGIFKKFKKALAVVFRNKIVKGLVKVAATTFGGPAGAKIADAGLNAAAGGPAKPTWKVPGLNIAAQDAKVWLNLLASARSGNAKAKAIINRVKVMARLGHPTATKTFWLLRDMEKVTPEVKQSIESAASGQPQVSEQAASEGGEPGAVPTAMVGACMLGAEPSDRPVVVRCMAYDGMTGGMYQVPFTMAMGANNQQKQRALAAKARAAKAKQAQAKAKAAAAARARAQQGRNQPTAQSTPGGYPQQTYNPYDPYGAQPAYDPYAAQYNAQPAYDTYSAAYTSGPQNYGDYSQAEMQPGFDPYSAASYGYDPSQFNQ